MTMTIGNDVFEYGCDLIDVTSLHRPDTSWRFTDTHGHEHRWHARGQPAGGYSASERYETPTLRWVKDGEEFWEDDDEPHDVGHLECVQCAEHVEPRYTADCTKQYMPGLRWYRINGESVTKEVFQAKMPRP